MVKFPLLRIYIMKNQVKVCVHFISTATNSNDFYFVITGDTVVENGCLLKVVTIWKI